MATKRNSTAMRLEYADLEQFGYENRREQILGNCWYINRDVRDTLWGWVEQEGITTCPEALVGVKRFTVTDRDQ